MSKGLDLTDETVIAAIRQQVSCGLADEAVILSLDNGVYYGLNSVGARIWELLAHPRTVADLRSLLVQEFDVDAARCAGDLQALLGELSNHGLIEVRNGVPTEVPPAPAD